jgi:ectoine hydroxylase-related dioxygenase (phytanoyl-CoA dioxygenase family)
VPKFIETVVVRITQAGRTQLNTPFPSIAAEHVQSFREDGFFVLEKVVSAHDLQALRSECQRFIDHRDAEMDRLGVDTLDLDHRGRRYFVHAYNQSLAVRQFLASDLMIQIARAALGETVYLFNEQYVVKAAERGMKFSWHQDSGFIEYPHVPYLTCWIALDDVTEDNGTVYLLPYSRAGTRAVGPPVRHEATHDLVGYFGDDPGDPVIAPAGSIACFSSTVLHRSGPNTTGQTRRIYLAQYSPEPILNADRSGPRHLAHPLVVNGRRKQLSTATS